MRCATVEGLQLFVGQKPCQQSGVGGFVFLGAWHVVGEIGDDLEELTKLRVVLRQQIVEPALAK
jgi:hypothetical protein